VQESEAISRQTIRTQALEIERLKALITGDSGPNESGSDNEIPRAKKAKTSETAKSSDKESALVKDAMQAGKKFTVCNLLWTTPGAIRYLVHLSNHKSEDLTESDDDSDETTKDQAQLIYHSLSAHLRPYVKTSWFRTRVRHLLSSVTLS
jgi:hypothetical protein